MKLETVAVGEAAGRILPHRRRLTGRTIAKGVPLRADDLDALLVSGVHEIEVVLIETNDVQEDRAAEDIARAAAGDGLEVLPGARGRAEIVARFDGLLVLDRERLDRFNASDERVALSTVNPYARITAGQVVAIGKVMPMAVPGDALSAATELLRGSAPALLLAGMPATNAGLVLVRDLDPAEESGDRIELTIRARLDSLGSRLSEVRTCPRSAEEIGAALLELLEMGARPLLIGGEASAAGRHDPAPRAVESLGGEIVRVGLPVEPGNLMLIARLRDTAVLTVPACATSPRRTAFDVLLERAVAGVGLDPPALAALGVGGFLSGPLTSARSRRVAKARPSAGAPPLAGVVLAAGRSSRMGDDDKLLLEVDGVAMVRRVVDVALEAGLEPVVVVTGPDPTAVEEALEARGVVLVPNDRAELGMSTSLAAGINALEGSPAAGAAIFLGDMPLVTPQTTRALASAFAAESGGSACVPVHEGRRGNPVLWSSAHFRELTTLRGDSGAKQLLVRYDRRVVEVPVSDPGVLVDVDDVASLDAVRRRAEGKE